jgi:hydrogenase nickel incorporation protein HypA/HybF
VRILQFRRLRWTPARARVYARRMHEVGIMAATIAAVLRETRARHATRVHRIVLRVGALSGVDPESLRFAFDVVARETPAAEAVLEIETLPGRAHCAACAADFAASSGYIFCCPRCRRLSGDIRQGRELELFRLEMS